MQMSDWRITAISEDVVYYSSLYYLHDSSTSMAHAKITRQSKPLKVYLVNSPGQVCPSAEPASRGVWGGLSTDPTSERELGSNSPSLSWREARRIWVPLGGEEPNDLSWVVHCFSDFKWGPALIMCDPDWGSCQRSQRQPSRYCKP